MAFSPTTLATNIAALTIAGVTVKAISTTPDLITARDVPLLVPAPDFVTNIVGVPISMGIAGGAFYQYTYQAQYLFYLGAVGGERITATQRLACLQKIELIAAAIKAADTTL